MRKSQYFLFKNLWFSLLLYNTTSLDVYKNNLITLVLTRCENQYGNG